MRTWNLMLAAVLLAASPVRSAALSAAQRCESSFESASARYVGCRLVGEAKYTKTSDEARLSAVLATCAKKLSDALGKATTNFGSGNCTSETPATFNAYLAQCSNAVEAASSFGGTLPTCGDGAVNVVGEQCDSGNLAGETCSSLGLPSGTLSCDASCQFNIAGCVGACTTQLFPASGQTTCWNSVGAVIPCVGTGHDGDVQAGATLAYTDNGDGTITDGNTGPMWEKLDDNNVGGVHDWDNTYSWDSAFAVKISALNAGGGFAGHTDWRVPSIKELQSVVNYEIQYPGPAVSAAFNNNCVPGCTASTCSCTRSRFYFSSSTYVNNLPRAWGVEFVEGFVGADDKMSARAVRAVRAVRGGS